MKKYKTWEAIKMLTENPKLHFKSQDTTLKIDSINKDIEKVNRNDINIYININDEWELVQQEVPFVEAIKAHKSGKTIYCLNGNSKATYERKELTDRNKVTITDGEILEGHWYIKED